MPTYEFYCDPEEGGCGNLIQISCPFAEKEEKRPKSCKKCRKRKSLIENFGGDTALLVHSTLGSHIDKQSSKMSEDEKQHLKNRHNEYRKKDGPSWVSTENGMVHRKNL